MVQLEGVSTSADTGDDSALDSDAQRFVEETYNEENYEKWGTNAMMAANGEGGFTSPGEALQNRYGLGDDEVDGYTSKHQTNTERAVEDGSYEDGLQTFASEDEADDSWASRFVSGIQNA
jgi:hypothetical protein